MDKAADRSSARTARENVQRLKEEISHESTELSESQTPPAAPLAPGSAVTMLTGGNAGEIVSIAADGRTAVVVFGQVKMRVPLADLRPAQR